MRHLSIIALALAGLMMASCGGHNAGAANDTAGSNTSSSIGNASFSYKIDGKAVSGNEIDAMQLSNTAFIYPPAGTTPQRVLFDLTSTKEGEDYYVFRLWIPDKEGVYQITKANHEQTHGYVQLAFWLKSANNYSDYNEDSLTINIDKISPTRISGTFSGTLKLYNDTPGKYKSPITITDGKFDIPFSTGNLRPI
jgi:hypothetical protein